MLSRPTWQHHDNITAGHKKGLNGFQWNRVESQHMDHTTAKLGVSGVYLLGLDGEWGGGGALVVQ